jgi:copper chaperone
MFKSITFEVIGDQQLHCESCEQHVERLLKSVQGVGQVRAQAKNQRIEVLFDTAVLDANVITKRLGDAGYKTRLGGSTSNSGKRDDITESGLQKNATPNH